jgi:uncharacterized protein YoxC
VVEQQKLNNVINRVNDFNRRIRDLEERIRNNSGKLENVDETLLDKTNSLSRDIQDLEDELGELRDRIANIEVDIKEIRKQNKKFIEESQIEEFENYMDLMNPLNSSFLTEQQAKRMIEEKEDADGLTEEEVIDIVDRRLKNRGK